MKYTELEAFPEQLIDALEIGAKVSLQKNTFPIQRVFVTGMGNAALSAHLVSECIRAECPIPFTIGKRYDVPAYVNKYTLGIVSSYSGNTEEALFAFDQMMEKDAKIVVIACGGKLLKRAKERGVDYIKLPNHFSSSSSVTGYGFVLQLFILHKLGIIADTRIKEIGSAAFLLKNQYRGIQKKAKKVATFLYRKKPIIYTSSKLEPVALRLRQQLNQKAKILCWHHVLPEMNHNELIGWRYKREDFAVLYLRNKNDFYLVQSQLELNKKIVAAYTQNILEVFSEGKYIVEQQLYLLHLSDWIALFLAKLRGVDPNEMEVVNFFAKRNEENTIEFVLEQYVGEAREMSNIYI